MNKKYFSGAHGSARRAHKIFRDLFDGDLIESTAYTALIFGFNTMVKALPFMFKDDAEFTNVVKARHMAIAEQHGLAIKHTD